MLLSAMSVLVVAQSSSEIPEGLMNNHVYVCAFVGMKNKQYKMHDMYLKIVKHCFVKFDMGKLH